MPVPDLDTFQIACFAVDTALAFAWATLAVSTWRRGTLFLGHALRRVVLSQAIGVTIFWVCWGVEALVPLPLRNTPPGWLVPLYVVQSCTLFWIGASSNHHSRLVSNPDTPPGWTWLTFNYLPVLPLTVLAIVFPRVFPGQIDGQRRMYIAVSILALSTWLTLAVWRSRHIVRRGRWRPGFAALGNRRRDAIVLAGGVIALVMMMPLLLGSDTRWLSLLGNAVVGVLLSLPMVARIGGQVARWGTIAATMLFLIGGSFFAARVVATPLAAAGLDRLATLIVVVTLTAAALIARPGVDAVSDYVLLRGRRRQWWSDFEAMIRALPAEAGVHACCSRYVEEAASRFGLDGVAIVLGDGFAVAAGNLSAAALGRVWRTETRLTDEEHEPAVRLVGIGEMPGRMADALAAADVTTIMQFAGARCSWGHIFFSVPGFLGTSDPAGEAAALTAAAELGGVLDVAALIERTVAAELSLAEAKERELRHEEVERSREELSRAYTELRSTQRQLLQSEKMASLGELVAGVAHEINNPVSFIVGNLRPIQRKLDAIAAAAAEHEDPGLRESVAHVREMFEHIGSGAERTAGIVRDLRTFSRIGDAPHNPCDVHECLEVALRLLRPKWEQRITIERAYGTVPQVPGISGQLNQVFMNLLSNACDAINGRGSIGITTTCDDTHVRVAIADDGTGIADAEFGRIFDPFFTTKPQGKGTGLGLSISHGIIEQHGGRIEVESQVGRGTTFTVALLRAAPSAS